MRYFFFGLMVVLLFTACPPAPEAPPQLDDDMFIDDPVNEERDRSIWQQPGAVMDAMGDIREKVIADIGAGKGFFAKRLALVADRVIAVEINDSLIVDLEQLREVELPKEFRPRLEPRLGTESDPKLERSEVDIILLVNTFMYIENQEDYLKKLYPALRSDGRIVIVDWKKRDTIEGPQKSKRLALGTLEEQLKAAGFHIVSSDDGTLKYQYIVVADKVRE